MGAVSFLPQLHYSCPQHPCPAHLILLNFITLIIFGKLRDIKLLEVPAVSVTTSVNIFYCHSSAIPYLHIVFIRGYGTSIHDVLLSNGNIFILLEQTVST
jgi:hypothetical protein